MQSRILLILFTSLFLLEACRKTTIPTHTKEPLVMVRDVDFNSFQGKARLNYQHNNKGGGNVNVHVRIKKDSIIWMSFSSFGILGARVLASKDSIIIVEPFRKRYSVFDYKILSKHFGVDIDYPLIQAVLLGNLILPQRPNDQVSKTSNYTILQQIRKNLKIINHITITSQNLEQVKLHNTNSKNLLELNYTHFQDVEGQHLSKKIEINLFYTSDEGTTTYKVALDYNTLKLNNDELKFPFTIPQRYERR